MHSAQNCARNIECRKIQRRYSWFYRSALSATAKRWSRLSTWQCKKSYGSCCQDFLNQNHIHVLPWPALSPDLSPIEHWWDELSRRVCHRHNPPETPQELHDALVHEWNNIPQAFIQRLIDWFYASEMRSCCCCKRWSHTLLNSTNLHTAWKFCLSMICSDNDVEKFCWFCLICYAHMNLNYTIFVDFFSLCKKYWASNPCIVSFVD
jgi:hypothetical protein